jgi:putative Holliday junction resolvase
MNLLGIDFGEKKIGLALATGPLAEPIGVIKNSKLKSQISKLCQDHGIEKIVIGISEGTMAEKTKKFSQELAEIMGLPIEFQDETLTTNEAIVKMKEAGKKIKNIDEDSFSAALILQSYLDRMEGDYV